MQNQNWIDLCWNWTTFVIDHHPLLDGTKHWVDNTYSLNSFEVTNIQIGGKMKDKTIIFGIFLWYICWPLHPQFSSEAGSKTEDKSSSSCCPPPSITLHYPHNQVFYCRDRPGYEQTWIRRYAKLSQCPEKASTGAFSLLKVHFHI